MRIFSSIDIFTGFQEAKMSQIRLKSSFQKTAIIFVPLLMFDRCLQIDLRKPEKIWTEEQIFHTYMFHSFFWGMWALILKRNVSYIITNFLNKLVRSRCLDNSLFFFFFFCVSVDLDSGSVCESRKKSLAYIMQSWSICDYASINCK